MTCWEALVSVASSEEMPTQNNNNVKMMGERSFEYSLLNTVMPRYKNRGYTRNKNCLCVRTD